MDNPYLLSNNRMNFKGPQEALSCSPSFPEGGGLLLIWIYPSPPGLRHSLPDNPESSLKGNAGDILR
jgi:hypothetical protein